MKTDALRYEIDRQAAGRIVLGRHLGELKASKGLWMRSVSFAGLHRILHLVAEQPDGLRPAELNAIIRSGKVYETQRGASPAATTLYHGRNTLLNLKALLRVGKRLIANRGNPHVLRLLDRSPSQTVDLDDASREAFAELVLQDQHCKGHFFDLFMTIAGSYSAQDFRSTGAPVTWRRVQSEDKRSLVVLTSRYSGRDISLETPSEFNAVLYGLRYWARDELRLVDEFYRDGRGFVMYPIIVHERERAIADVIEDVRALCSDEAEWTTLSVHDLLELCGEKRRRPVAHVFAAIRRLASLNSGQVVLIPTSRSFAALGAGFNEQRQELELRSYLRDSIGRYISHIRLHESIRSLPCLS